VRELVEVLAMNSTQDTQDIGLAKKAIAREVNRTLREKLARLRKAYPKLSFNALWERLKEQEAGLFAQAKRIEVNDWGSGKGPSEATKSSLSRVQSGDYISVRSEDIRQLERIEASLR
jgi:hypothetical protein